MKELRRLSEFYDISHERLEQAKTQIKQGNFNLSEEMLKESLFSPKHAYRTNSSLARSLTAWGSYITTVMAASFGVAEFLVTEPEQAIRAILESAALFGWFYQLGTFFSHPGTRDTLKKQGEKAKIKVRSARSSVKKAMKGLAKGCAGLFDANRGHMP